MSAVTFEPLISPPLWIALAFLAAGAMIWQARHRPKALTRRRWGAIVGLTSIGIAAVLIILLNPTWLEPIPPPPGRPQLTLLLDQSASMATADSTDGRNRFAQASELAVQHVPQLSERFDVRVRAFADQSVPAPPEQLSAFRPEGTSSDLAGALSGALGASGFQGHAILLVSDGIHNGPGGLGSLREALQTSRAMDVPIYTLTIGGDAAVRDLAVSVARPQELSFVGQQVPVPVVVRQRGRLAERAEVTLLKEGRPIAHEVAQLSADGATPVRFHVTEGTSGLYRYEVRVSPLEGEASEGNNSAAFLLRVVDNPVRILLLEGKPYWDAKFLIRTLAADPSVELDAIVRVADARYLKRSLRLPRTELSVPAASPEPTDAPPAGAGETTAPALEAARRVESTEILRDLSGLLNDDAGLSAYQLLVLGRDSEAFLSDGMVERLREWISHDGGALVCYRGTPVATANQNLARLLPVRWTPSRETRFRTELTERGNDLDWLNAAAGGNADGLGKLPSLASSSIPEHPKPQSVVLVRAQDEQGPAVVTYQPYGTGRVVAVEGAGMWRWAFLAPQFQGHEQTYSALWQSLFRWLVSGVGLMPGQDLMLRTDKVTFNVTESVSTTLLMRPEAERNGVPTIELLSTEGASVGEFTPVPFGEEPGVYRVPLGHLPEGNYRAVAIRHGETGPSGTGSSVAFDVRSFSSERLDVRARPDIMARIAQESSGAVLSPDTLRTLGDLFQKHYNRSRPDQIRRLTAWDRWWGLGGIIAVWGVAWALRRSAGLI